VAFAGISVRRRHDLGAAPGSTVAQQRQHAGADRARVGAVDPVREGLERTYRWIHDELAGRVAVSAAAR
jgi:hypothetical protein